MTQSVPTSASVPQSLSSHLSSMPSLPSPQTTQDSLQSCSLHSALEPMESTPICESSKRDSYKDRRKHYRKEKKKVAEELMSTLNDPTVVVLAEWLKVRSTLKAWNKFWCELKPGLLLLYKSTKTHKSGNWVGTVIINVCEMIERPSKKNGFCFKLFHPLEHPIWAPKGPHGESFGVIMFPLPMSHLIFRAPSQTSGKKWMQAIELALRCSTLLVRHLSTRESVASTIHADNSVNNEMMPHEMMPHEMMSNEDVFRPATNVLNESEIEKHFDHDLDDEPQTDHGSQDHHSSDESDSDEEHINGTCSTVSNDNDVTETVYVQDGLVEEFGITGDAGQTEEVADENKSLIWSLLKQVRPGMDLSKVVLPTFILEPRSFLDKLTDYYYHCDIISKAVVEEDALLRMKMIVQWYLSGFYKKPKGLKKPYNPILGEKFRCYWWHPETESRTFYIAEQVSHHPPVSAFYVTNRKDGFSISGSILAKSKFYGNSISAILEGTARLSLLSRGEDYLLTFPYAHCKGILMGTLALELGGKVSIKCDKTGYHTDIEFKLKPFLGSSDLCNLISGKIRLGNETLGTIEGHWDSDIYFKDKRNGVTELFWSPTSTIKANRLKRFMVPLQHQGDFESEKLWQKVTLAIQKQDQFVATQEKTILEEAQRLGAKERLAKMEKWVPKLFVFDEHLEEWIYINADTRPWDPRTDVKQYELDFVIQTKTRHKRPALVVTASGSVRGSVVSVEQNKTDSIRSPKQKFNYQRSTSCASEESSSVGHDGHESTESDRKNKAANKSRCDKLIRLLEPIQELQQETNLQLIQMQKNLESLIERQNQVHLQLIDVRDRRTQYFPGRRAMSDLTLIAVILVAQLVLNWFLKKWQ